MSPEEKARLRGLAGDLTLSDYLRARGLEEASIDGAVTRRGGGLSNEAGRSSASPRVSSEPRAARFSRSAEEDAEIAADLAKLVGEGGGHEDEPPPSEPSVAQDEPLAASPIVPSESAAKPLVSGSVRSPIPKGGKDS